MREVTLREFVVRLRGGIELPLLAHTPEHACDQIAKLHPALGEAIISVGADEMDMTGVRGQCEKCRSWVLALEGRLQPLPRLKVKCSACAGGKRIQVPPSYAPQRPQKTNRKGRMPDGDGSHDDCWED